MLLSVATIYKSAMFVEPNIMFIKQANMFAIQPRRWCFSWRTRPHFVSVTIMFAEHETMFMFCTSNMVFQWTRHTCFTCENDQCSLNIWTCSRSELQDDVLSHRTRTNFFASGQTYQQERFDCIADLGDPLLFATTPDMFTFCISKMMYSPIKTIIYSSDTIKSHCRKFHLSLLNENARGCAFTGGSVSQNDQI